MQRTRPVLGSIVFRTVPAAIRCRQAASHALGCYAISGGSSSLPFEVSSISKHLLMPAFATQCRMYGSKKKNGNKKGGKNKKNDEEEEPDEPYEMTLDMDKMDKQMAQSVERFESELRSMRAGRANPAILDHIRVQLKSGHAVLSDLAMISVNDAHSLMVIPNNEDDMKAIDQSIRSAGLGLNPHISKSIIIVPVPKSTKESRMKLVKELGALAEHTRVHVRKHRQDAMKCLKADSKHKMPKDEVKGWEKDIQTKTDKHIEKINDLLKAKTSDIEKT